MVFNYLNPIFLDLINYNENEKENENNLDPKITQTNKKTKNIKSNEDLDQICLDNINNLLY